MKLIDPITWLRDEVGLHDVFVESIILDVSRQTMIISVEDVNANFANMSGYCAIGCELRFETCKAVWIDVEPADGITFSDANIAQVGDRFKFEATLRYGAGSEFERRSSIAVSFGELSVVEKRATSS